MKDLWLLPAGVEELLPGEALRLEQLRRTLTDLCSLWGYDLVSPPLLEHLDALLESGGEDLELETFKLVDHVSGRQLGIRADMTPQIARIDAHVLNEQGPTRLCYAGPVLRARTSQELDSREQFQLGAELYGSESTRADVEVVELMMQCITACGFDRPHLDIGHVGVFRAMASCARLDRNMESTLFDALQRKSIPDLKSIVAGLDIDDELASALVSLPALRGPVSGLPAALERVSRACPMVSTAAENLRAVVDGLERGQMDTEMNFDLSELRGYHYHTGVVFSAFIEGHGREVARGGRYDDVGAVFGRARPATGFSLDLRQVIKLENGGRTRPSTILAPAVTGDAELERMVRELRAGGERVVRALKDGEDRAPDSCDRRLLWRDSCWQVVPATADA